MRCHLSGQDTILSYDDVRKARRTYERNSNSRLHNIMSHRPDDICPRPDVLAQQPTQSLAPAIYPTSVWVCNDTTQAEQLLAGQLPGYVYQRDGHPNADLFAEKCRQLHAAERCVVTSSGMSALALAILSQLSHGDHLVVGNRLYGRSSQLLTDESARWGITHTLVDTCDLPAVESAINPNTRLLVAETIANPRLEVADIAALAEAAHRGGARLLIDNTFATPALCRPLALGADFVMESVSKLMNGHSDVMLGVLCGPQTVWPRVSTAVSAWGLAASPFDCWLATRGLATLPLRVERTSHNAMEAALFLRRQHQVTRVDYPGLENHPQHELADRQFAGRFGSVVTFTLAGGRDGADRFIQAASRIPFCPSLGEVCTTLSHPESTSHRGLTVEQRAALGIQGGTIRLSLGVESPEFVLAALQNALAHW